MATDKQSKYIADLAVLKTKEFKEVKEMLLASGIVGDQAQLVKDAQSMAEITHPLTDFQASRFIDLLTAAKQPERGQAYSPRRIEGATAAIEKIKATIDSWDFD